MSELPKRPKAVIDAHHHIWDLRNDLPWLKEERIPFRYGDYSSICRNYMPDDYRFDTAGWPIVGSVYIEAEWNRKKAAEESRWVAEIAASSGVPSVMVGWCDLADPGAEELLSTLAEVSILRGIRHKPASAATAPEARRGEAGSMDDPVWRDGYRLLEQHGFSYDLQTPWWHLDAAAELARDVPQTPLIVNHTGLPADRSPEALQDWRKALETVAAQPNVFIKISGIGRPGLPWTVEANGPIIRDVISIFGIERAMFASNFPVDRLAGDFDTIFSGFLAATADFPEEGRNRLFHDNAARAYRLRDVKV
ncbi:amidohydrolase [Oceaniovalibus sp. ACAM 378]|uniref:amidohydrolase family protein n=1 Tax=Oceaniovalibus sp. ACAM 378 TaxID=2599923 RepID=UPI0011D5F5C3|nr:amidohydrolase family protein [Oceaniovalibus sp. ACAM 378]TYB84769.1 amidohydrolase family protein [Oceaniovalibus sp. ACAM 378]